jgi:hypothetical protein
MVLLLMLLIYESDLFNPIITHIRSGMTTEHGEVVEYSSYQQDGIVLGEGDRRAVYLSSNLRTTRNNLAQFVQDKKNPGLIFISSGPHLNNNHFLYTLFRQKVFSPQNVILVGQHRCTKDELTLIEKHTVHFFPMHEITREGCYEVSESIMSIAQKFSDVFVCIDSSVLDYPIIRSNSPGGLSTRELVYFIQRLKMMANVQSSEVVINPNEPRVGAKLVSELYKR